MRVMGTGRLSAASAVVAATFVVSGCATRPAPTLTPKPRPTATAAPTPTPPPAGPFAVLVTNSARAGTSYDVLVIDLAGRIVARVTANLPLLKQNQTIEPALVSASSSTVYYLNGDTNIWSLSVNGHSTLVKSIPAGATSSLGFAVSLDDARVAVAAMKQTANTAGSTGHGYVEDLQDDGGHVDLWSNTDLAALRWPAGWHGPSLIDQIETANYGCQYGDNACSQPASYHVVDTGGGSNTVAVCETPTTPLPDGNLNEAPTGLPTAAGTACAESEYTYSTHVQEDEIYAVDWKGTERSFADVKSTNGAGTPLPVHSCFLAPDGSRMACADNASQALTLLTPDGKTRNLGRRYNILGWIDATHLMAGIDSSTLAVLDVDNGAEIRVPLAAADKVTMVSALPGAL